MKRLVETSEMDGNVLNWAVMVAAGFHPTIQLDGKPVYYDDGHGSWVCPNYLWWNDAGPIIEKEHISIEWCLGNVWQADCCPAVEIGNSPQQAAMRCFVASKLGNQVEVPEELL